MNDLFTSIGNMLDAVAHNNFFGKLAVTGGALATAYSLALHVLL